MRRGSEPRGFIGDVLFALSGLLVWVAHFLVVYVATALLCARGAPGDIVPLVILIATGLAILALALILLRGRRRLRAESSGRRLLAALALFGAAIGLVAVIWEALPGAFLPSC